MRAKAAIIGAGALGLGFLAERMAPHLDLCLVDTSVKSANLERIQARQAYSVNVCHADGIEARTVSGAFETVVSDTEEGRPRFEDVLREADVILTATGRGLLDAIVPGIAPAVNARKRKGWLLFCENGLDIAEVYADRLKPPIVLADTVMSRMCRLASVEQEPSYRPMWEGSDTALVVEEYGYLPLDEDVCGGAPLDPPFALVSHEQFRCWESIKLYLHNGMHAFLSYHAHLEGAEFFPQTSERIREKAREVVLNEVVPAIVRTHPVVDLQEVEQYGLSILERCFNPFFNDSIARGIRGTRQKLQPGGRLLGGCDFIRKAGIDPVGYASTIDAAKEIIAREA